MRRAGAHFLRYFDHGALKLGGEGLEFIGADKAVAFKLPVFVVGYATQHIFVHITVEIRKNFGIVEVKSGA